MYETCLLGVKVVEDIVGGNYEHRGASSTIKGGAPTHLHQRGVHSLNEGLCCHLEGVVRGGGGFQNQVGHLKRGGRLSSHACKQYPTLLSTPKPPLTLGIAPLGV